MRSSSLEKLGALSLILGALLFAIYSALFPIALPMQHLVDDYVEVVLNANWTRLALLAMVGILLMLVGFYAVYARIRDKAGAVGAIGFLFIEAAYLLQACKVTWELFLFPIIARHTESAFLLRDGTINHDGAVEIFRNVSSLTILVGIILFCYSLYRSNEFPKAAPILVFFGALVYAVGPIFSILVSIGGIFTLALGCFLLGVHLLRERGTSSAHERLFAAKRVLDSLH